MADQTGSGPDPGLGKGGGPTIKPTTTTFSDPPAKPSDSTNNDSHASPRPDYNRSNTDSSLPAHLREAVINIPVTPGIATRTYSPESSRDSREATGSPSYFQSKPLKEVIASPEPLDDDGMAATAPEGADAASMSGHDILRRMSKSSQNRRESINDIRAAYPSLPLSGNVISATFNMPHSLKYRKAADWVSALLEISAQKTYPPTHTFTHIHTCKTMVRFADDILVCTGTEISPWAICALRRPHPPFFRCLLLEPYHCRMDRRDRCPIRLPLASGNSSSDDRTPSGPKQTLRSYPSRQGDASAYPAD